MNKKLLSNALENYDIIYKKSKDYYLIMSNDINKKFNERFILKSEKIVLNMKYEVELIGSYILDQQIWIWGWLTNDTKIYSIVDWCYKSIKSDIDLYNSTIRSMILNSKFIISDIIQLDILNSLALYLYKSDLILEYKYQNNIIYYFSIKYI